MKWRLSGSEDACTYPRRGCAMSVGLGVPRGRYRLSSVGGRVRFGSPGHARYAASTRERPSERPKKLPLGDLGTAAPARTPGRDHVNFQEARMHRAKRELLPW
jgi:hypothetical protein